MSATIHESEGITLAKNPAVSRRKMSLFEVKERAVRDEDRGIAVVTHADYPLRSRSIAVSSDRSR